MSCPICNGVMRRDPKAENNLALQLAPKPFIIIKCSHCKFRSLDPIPSQDDLESIYTEEYFEDSNRGYFYTSQVEETLLAFKATASEFKLKLGKGKTILDVGCASGEFIDALEELDLVTKGIEPSEYCVDICLKKGLDVVHGGIYAPGTDDIRADGIHMSHVLEHLPEPNKAIERIKHWLKPDGLVYIEVPLQFDGFLERAQSIRRASEKKFDSFSIHHCSFFSPHSLELLLSNHGLRVLSLTTYNPNRRAAREKSVRKALLSIFLSFSNLFRRGDVIGVWAERATE